MKKTILKQLLSFLLAGMFLFMLPISAKAADGLQVVLDILHEDLEPSPRALFTDNGVASFLQDPGEPPVDLSRYSLLMFLFDGNVVLFAKTDPRDYLWEGYRWDDIGDKTLKRIQGKILSSFQTIQDSFEREIWTVFKIENAGVFFVQTAEKAAEVYAAQFREPAATVDPGWANAADFLSRYGNVLELRLGEGVQKNVASSEIPEIYKNTVNRGSTLLFGFDLAHQSIVIYGKKSDGNWQSLNWDSLDPFIVFGNFKRVISHYDTLSAWCEGGMTVCISFGSTEIILDNEADAAACLDRLTQLLEIH